MSADKKEEFDWIQTSIGMQEHKETFIEKATRKTKENPFVPIGMSMTLSFIAFTFLQSFVKYPISKPIHTRILVLFFVLCLCRYLRCNRSIVVWLVFVEDAR